MASESQDRIDLHEILGTIRRGFWLIAASMIIVGGAAAALSLTQTKQYAADASLLFRDPAFDQKLFGSTFQARSQDPDRQAATNVQLVGLKQVAERTARRPDVTLTAEQVTDAVAVAANGRSDLVTITATAADPKEAAAVANGFAAEFIEFRRQADRKTIFDAQQLVEGQIKTVSGNGDTERATSLRDRAEELYVLGSLQTGNAEQVQRAEAPDSPASPKPVRSTVMGVLLGCFLGIGLVLLRARLDRRLRTPEALESAFGRPVLALVPVAKEFETGNPSRRSRAEEAFSTLWTNLRYFNVTRKIDSVIVTSPKSGDGKTTVALNLATAAARTGSRVLLLEADLRRPSLWERIAPGRPQLGGLTQVLAGSTNLEDATTRLETGEPGASNGDRRGLDVVVAGPIPPNPAEMLDSEPMRALLREVRERYDLVVIDAPPSTVVPDAIPLLQQVSAVLVVARGGTTTRDEAAELSAQLTRLDAPLVGVVANYAADAGARSGYYYGDDIQREFPREQTPSLN
jgi:succinoglycan biosynthesis transport protein ExoP